MQAKSEGTFLGRSKTSLRRLYHLGMAKRLDMTHFDPEHYGHILIAVLTEKSPALLPKVTHIICDIVTLWDTAEKSDVERLESVAIMELNRVLDIKPWRVWPVIARKHLPKLESISFKEACDRYPSTPDIDMMTSFFRIYEYTTRPWDLFESPNASTTIHSTSWTLPVIPLHLKPQSEYRSIPHYR